MSIRLVNVNIENCGTGIKADGLINIDMQQVSFKNNNKDLDLNVEQGSSITINQFTSTGCKTESIIYKEYNNNIADIKYFVETKTDYFSNDEIKKIKHLLDEMNNSKDNPTKISKILNDIRDIGKSTSANLLAAYIKIKFGW